MARTPNPTIDDPPIYSRRDVPSLVGGEFTATGWGCTHEMRLRQVWFWCTLEELWVHEDGRREWRRKRTPLTLVGQR